MRSGNGAGNETPAYFMRPAHIPLRDQLQLQGLLERRLCAANPASVHMYRYHAYRTYYSLLP
jgi:hypothetical protein